MSSLSGHSRGASRWQKWKVNLWRKRSPPSLMTANVRDWKQILAVLTNQRAVWEMCCLIRLSHRNSLLSIRLKIKARPKPGDRRWGGSRWPAGWQPGAPGRASQSPRPQPHPHQKGPTELCLTALLGVLNKKTREYRLTSSKLPTTRFLTMWFKEYIPNAWNFFLKNSSPRNTEETWLLRTERLPSAHHLLTPIYSGSLQRVFLLLPAKGFQEARQPVTYF